MQSNGTQNWSDLAIGLYERLNDRKAEITYEMENLEMTIMTIDKSLSAHYFRTVRQIVLPQVFPKFLHDECPKHHGVVACEGSMFKSKFADALSTMMAGALGIANTESRRVLAARSCGVPSARW